MPHAFFDSPGSPPLCILHLDCTMGKGGQERDHINEAREFRRRGHLYLIGARPGTPLLDMADHEGIGIPFAMRSNFDILSFLAIRRFIRKNRVDVLVTTSYIDSTLGWFAALSLGASRPPVIRQRHILNPPNNLLPYRHFCDRLVAVSDIARYLYVERKIPFWKVVSIPRGIPIPEPPDSSSPDPLPGLPESARILLQIGTFQRDKGQLPLMEALLPALGRDPSFHLVFLGDGALVRNLDARRGSPRFREVRDRIHFPGWTDPAPYYRRAAVTVIPSFRESFSLVALESLHAGVPVVGFRQGGLPEIFHRIRWGELVDPFDFKKLGEVAATWAARPALSCPDLDTIRKSVSTHFSIARSVDLSARFYRWSIERRKAGETGNPYRERGGAADPFFVPDNTQERRTHPDTL